MSGKSILIMGDAHAHIDYPNDRFEIAGEALMDIRPDVFIQVGDMAEVSALNTYMSRTEAEGMRLKDDFDVTRDAQSKLFKAMRKYNAMRGRNKKRKYDPEMYLTIGNHEERVDRYIEANPTLEGCIGIEDFGYQENGFIVIPFLKPLFVCGIQFQHYLPTRAGKRRAMAGVSLARKLILEKHNSVVVGHNHMLQMAEDARGDGSKMFGLTAGCFLDPSYDEQWSEGTDEVWWSGLVFLENVVNGYPERVDFLTFDALKRRYG